MDRWTQLPRQVHAIVASSPGSVLLQTSRFDPDNKLSFLFLNAIDTISAFTLEEIPKLFRRIEEALEQGFHVAGFVGYECGYHFERFPGVAVATQGLPLAWFGVYQSPIVYDHEKGCFEGNPLLPLSEDPLQEMPDHFVDHVSLTIAEGEYCRRIRMIKEYIGAGETYQVNFTDRVRFPVEMSAGAAFGTLLNRQPVAYSAFLNVADHHILSLSPELFFRIDQGRILTRPMKGTMPRGLDAAEDTLAAVRLQNDEKNCSEHVMIVDLLRNDLGRVCTMGSVRVNNMFAVEKYQTLLQMTSTVSGALRPGLSYYEIFKSIFPSGSITGAPKIRTMQIIHEMEERPRGIYTGSIGFISPNGSSIFNVAIRTLVLKDGEANMGVGGGIVADSDPAEEYNECLLKAEFLIRRVPRFQLFETMLWDGAYGFLSMHLDRLESSAAYFDFPFNRADVSRQLQERSALLSSGDCYRVRLLLDAAGSVLITTTRHAPHKSTGYVRMSPIRMSSKDVFLRHKTTNREIYEQEYARAHADGYDETIFLNEREEVTEGAISNIFIRQAGKLLTPPLSSGVLPGIFRRHLLETDATAEECVLTVHDIESAEAVFICNSLRGIRQVAAFSVNTHSSPQSRVV